jgi:hypothetical protein
LTPAAKSTRSGPSFTPATTGPIVRAALVAVTETLVADHDETGNELVMTKRSPQLAACPAMATWELVTSRKI